MTNSDEPKAERRKIMVEVDAELHRRAKVKAALTGKSMSRVMREALQKWVDENDSVAAVVRRDDTSPLSEEF